MDRSEYIPIIHESENLFPVNEWTIDNIHMWPFIRTTILIENGEEGALISKNKQNQQTQSVFKTNYNLIKELFKGILRSWKASFKDRKHNIKKIEPTDVVIFYSSNYRYFKFKNLNYYGPIPDTFQYYLSKLNLKTVALEYDFKYDFRLPRYNSSKFVQVPIELARIKATINKSKEKKKIQYKLEGYETFVKYIHEKGLYFSINTSDDLIFKFLVMKFRKEYFKKILMKLQPKLSFEICYYTPEVFAYTLACKELNIPIIDIQHGVQGQAHLAYNKWNKVPSQGYQLLPDRFWVWSNYEASIIKEWSVPNSLIHAPYIGGDLWINFWKDQNNSLFEKYETPIKFIKKKHIDKIHLLVTLDPEWQETEIIFQIMQNPPSNWFWWIRLHPRMHNQREIIRNLLKKYNLRYYELDLASDFPLPILLKNVNLHITTLSSVIIEAEKYNIQSIFTDKNAINMFPQQITNRFAHGAYSKDEIINTVNTLISIKKNSNIKEPDEKEQSDKIRELFILILNKFKKT